MTDEIYISMTGYDNELWPRCRDEGLVALGFEQAYFEAWHSNDRAEFLALVAKESKRQTSASDIKARATLWFNRATLISSSNADLWLHRDGAKLFWAETTSGEALFEHYNQKVMIAKPVVGWSDRDSKGALLSWNSIHPRARDYLVTQQAIFRVANEDMKAYLHALVEGHDLLEWHARPAWQTRMGQQKYLGKNLPQLERVLYRLMSSIRSTVQNSNGQIVLRTLKEKNLLCSDEEMKNHLRELWEKQEGLCAITHLPMHVDAQPDFDWDMLVSPDRIDSNGHYAIGNMQLVCRFVNFWKCSQENGKFVDLLNKIIDRKQELLGEGQTADTQI